MKLAKNDTMKKIIKTALLLACACSFSTANSQSPSAIHVVDRPFMDTPGTLPIATPTQSAPNLPLASIGAQPSPASQQTWTAQIEDRTIRGVITRWARDNQWQFNSSHWTLPSDLPILAPSVFTGDFREVIRQLLSSTELTDLPAQPCFYTNKVIRVVPRAELCDRTASRQNGFSASAPVQIPGQ